MEKDGREMKRLALTVKFCFLALSALIGAPPAHAAPEAKAAATAPTMSATDLRNGMRKLWSEPPIPPQSYTASAVVCCPVLPAVPRPFLRTKDDTGSAIKPIYGEEA